MKIYIDIIYIPSLMRIFFFKDEREIEKKNKNEIIVINFCALKLVQNFDDG